MSKSNFNCNCRKAIANNQNSKNSKNLKIVSFRGWRKRNRSNHAKDISDLSEGTEEEGERVDTLRKYINDHERMVEDMYYEIKQSCEALLRLDRFDYSARNL